MDEDPAGRRALLPRRPESAGVGSLDGPVELGVGCDDERVVPSELELHATPAGGRALANAVADRDGARERDRPYLRVSTSAAPTDEPEPVSTLSTPGGSPASAKHSATWSPVRGASCASLRTTVFPWISAGASFHTGIAIGKFHGVINPTTPSGRRTVYRR